MVMLLTSDALHDASELTAELTLLLAAELTLLLTAELTLLLTAELARLDPLSSSGPGSSPR